MFFVSAHSKGVAGGSAVSAHSTRLKVAVFSVAWRWLVSADSKGVTGAFIILSSKLVGSAHSKGVRRTAWRGRMAHEAQENRANITTPLYHIGTVCQ